MPLDGTNYSPVKEIEAVPDTELGWILWEAANYIEKKGWCRHKFEDEDGRVCALGSVRFAIYGKVLGIDPLSSPEYPQAIRYFREYINKCTPNNSIPVQDWNDFGHNTKENVISTLRAAARAAK